MGYKLALGKLLHVFLPLFLLAPPGAKLRVCLQPRAPSDPTALPFAPLTNAHPPRPYSSACQPYSLALLFSQPTGGKAQGPFNYPRIEASPLGQPGRVKEGVARHQPTATWLWAIAATPGAWNVIWRAGGKRRNGENPLNHLVRGREIPHYLVVVGGLVFYKEIRPWSLARVLEPFLHMPFSSPFYSLYYWTSFCA
ncbi:hypothetical protein DL89DRAFT_103927 [Linderina pennispora]|uniref:Uncharacterized protein n=1 Tax=Linderina pennispora TaxID=61395 RepID=A0A1Y1WFA6_9FUNG|nr:uncharacterized protein DL89DRAFT_103927 [Linderina pennispora]ORX71926.1 hypothetical protein DL89DRAFT_103927 [Linderina pennispora]